MDIKLFNFVKIKFLKKNRQKIKTVIKNINEITVNKPNLKEKMPKKETVGDFWINMLIGSENVWYHVRGLILKGQFTTKIFIKFRLKTIQRP